jgi:hypothetical protein
MAVIDLEELDVDVVELSRAELLAVLDERCRALLDMSGVDFLAAVREGRQIDNPAAVRLAVLARALIDGE